MDLPLQTSRRNIIRSIGSDNSPLRKSVAITSTPRAVDVIVNDDEAERARRRSCLELQKRVSNIGTLHRSATPVSVTGNASDSESCAISEASLEDHYQTCLKLFTENKINTKNAWNLHIIEYMRAMMSKGLVMKETLKLASTSLDIGSKVYGLRVDDIHNDMFKLASAMARINVERDEERVEEAGDTDDQQDDSRTQKEAAKKNPEKKKRKRLVDDNTEELTIAKDESFLNGKIIYHNTQCVGATSTAQDRLYTLSSLSKQKLGWEQLVNCRTNFQYWTPLHNVQPESHSIPVTITVPFMDGIICPSFVDFVIDQWSPDNDDVPCGSQYPRPKGDEVIYDENGLPIPELDGSIHEMNDDHFDEPFEHGGDDIVEEVGNRQAAINKPVTFITSMRPGDGPLSDKPLQYSYRTVPEVNERYTLTGVWAGPAHWKIKYLQRPSTQATRETMNGAPQRGKRLRKSGPIPCTFFTEDFDERWTENWRKITRLQNNHLDKYSLPEDLCFSEANTKTFCMRPWLYAEVRGLESQRNGDSNLNMSTIYQYDNPNDAEYCSQTMDDDDVVADTGLDAETALEGDDHDDPNNMFQDDLDDIHNTVPTIKVPYATRAKKMDMKKLKEAIWKTMISIETGNIIIDEDEQMRNNIKLHEIKFSDTYKMLPSILPHRMTEELSYPMAFVAMLHLTNEQSLHLEGQLDLLDFKITKK